MTAASDNPYVGREQTLVKHFILEKYLERFAHVIAFKWDVVTYVDGFSGPWNARSEDFKDTSFYLALRQLRIARDTYAVQGRSIRIRCMFLERVPSAYARLEAFAQGVRDAEVKTLNADFESSIDDIVAFIRAGGRKSFPFVFIDPTGWTGFAMDCIAPLLRINPGEVLINFMTGHIRRFIESPDEQTQESFERLFGSVGYRNRFLGLAGQDREDAIVQAYVEAVKCSGDYKYVYPAIVLHPLINRTHFHLIYATRNPKGVEVFKSVDKKAMAAMERIRADAQQRLRIQKTGQHELPFAGEATYSQRHYESLRERYLKQAKQRILQLLKSQGRVLYDDLWAEALLVPLVWESDLKKDWIKKWQNDGVVRVEGLGPQERVPKREANHWVHYLA